jgi:branched-chain amino acid transport system substrate-binding protein
VAIMIATTVAGIGHAAAAEKTLRIGVLGPLSGSAAAYGAELVRGAEMRAEEINKAGGLKVGPDVYRMEVVAYDHKANAAEAATATNKLVYQDKIQYIVGNAIGATCNAAQTITEPQKVLFGFVCWGTKNLGPDKPYSFRTIHSQWEVVAPFYDWLKKTYPNLKKLAVLAPNDSSGQDSITAVVAAAKARGFDVVATDTFERGTKDFYPIMTKLLASKPDAIDLGGTLAVEASLIYKQAAELGFEGFKAWTGGQNLALLIELGGKAAENVFSPTNVHAKGDYVGPAVHRFAEEYERRFKEVPGVVAIGNYGAFDVFTKAMQTAGSVDPEKVMKALTENKFDSVWGTLIIGGKETYGIDRQFLYPVVVDTVKNGKVIDVVQVQQPQAK